MHLNTRSRSWLLLAVTAFILLVYHAFGYAGHFGYDDMFYARLATQLTNGTFQLNDEHFGYRWGLLLPLSFCYQLFGVNDHASALPALMASLLTAVLIAHALRERFVLQVLGVSLFVLNPWIIYYSDKIMPDCLVALSVFGAITSIHRQRFIASHQVVSNAALLVGSLFFGVLSKESILITAPLFMFIFFADILQRRNFKFWLFSMLFSVAILLTYFALIKYLTGDFMSRVHAIAANSYFNPCSYDQLPFVHTVKRVSWELVLAFVRGGVAVPLIFALVGLSALNRTDVWRMTTERSFFTVCALLAFLCANFMTTSISAYVPLCPDVRHYLFVVPLAAVAAAYTAYDFIRSKRFGFVLAILLTAVLVVSFVNGYEYTYYLYLPLLAFTLLRLFWPSSNNISVNGLVAVFVLILAIAPTRDALVNRRNGYIEQRNFIRRHVLTLTQPNVIVTDVVQQHFGEYYTGFNPRANVRFVAFRDLPLRTISNSANCYMLSTGYTRWMSGTDWEALPPFAKNENALKLEAEENGVKLFRLEPRMLR